MHNVMMLWTAKVTLLRGLVLVAGLLSCQVLAEPVKHAQGQLSFEQVPQRVAVFDLGVLDTLNALEIRVLGVPKSFARSYLQHFASASYTDIGTLFEPNYEAVAGLQPDLVFIGPRTQRSYATMQRIAPTFDASLHSQQLLQAFVEQTRTLGKVFNKQTKVDALLTKVEGKMAEVKTRAAKAGKVLLVMASGGKLTVFGAGSRYGWLFSELGLQSAVDSLGNSPHGEPISFEYIQRLNPERILVLDRDAAIGRQGSAQTLFDNPLVAKLSASKNRQITYLDGFAWYTVGSGLQAVNTILDQLLAALAV